MHNSSIKHKLFVYVLGEAIQALGEVPAGVLYARVVNHMSFEDYDRAIAALKDSKVVTEQFRLLRWIGPKP